MAPSRAAKQPTIPSTDPLSDSIRLPSTHPTVFKILSALSRPALLDLATEWCLPEYRKACGPYINEDFDVEDETCPWTAATTYDELIELYRDELSARKGSKRELLDRILEGDWRHGISLQQLAMAETQSILDSPGARRWTAFEIYNKSSKSKSNKTTPSPKQPKVNPPTFTSALHKQLSSLTKVHYYVSYPKSHNLVLIRVSLFDTPYQTPNFSITPELLAVSKTVFLAFPTNAPSYVYVSRPSSNSSVHQDLDTDSSSLLSFVTKSIGPALSRTGRRFALRPTALSARSLDTLLTIRGAGRSNAAGGGWSIFSDEQRGTELASVLDLTSVTSTDSTIDRIVKSKGSNEDDVGDETNKENEATLPPRRNPTRSKRPFQHETPAAHLVPSKRTRLQRETAGRFGVSVQTEGKDEISTTALSRFDVTIRDSFPASAPVRSTETTSKSGTNDAEASTIQIQPSNVRIGFQGRDVFAGIRRLTELGIIDANRIPAWMTGEGNVSGGVVKDGRLRS
jgi:central kinetochore subunit Mis15/CHL4